MGTVARLLADHVSLRLRALDRIGVAGYIPNLMYEGGLVRFLLHRASLVGTQNVPSPALLGHNHDRLVRDLERFVADHDVPVVRFGRGEAKEPVARPYQLAAAAGGRSGVVLVGKAQERMQIWRGWIDKDSPRSIKGHPHFCFSRQSAVPDHWYFYLWDRDWGPALIKLSTYAPYGLWVMANGHEWAKRQLARAKIGFKELDNGLWTVQDPPAAQQICDQLGSRHFRGLIDRWLPELPSPLTALDRHAGYRWAYSIRQIEIADTAVFDRPAAGRAWFEAAIRDHIDCGRPDNVTIIFGRRVLTRGKNQTPGSFSTQILTPGTRVRIAIRYKTSHAKAYLKEGRALRVETVINNPAHFELNKTLNSDNWRALRRVGGAVNARFLHALGESSSGVPDPAALQAVVLPTIHHGQRAPGLRFGEPRVMALLSSITSFEHATRGLTNRTLVTHMADLHHPDYTSRQATYDLRRLRLKGLIQRIPHTHRYQVTDHGRATATFLSRLAARVITPTLNQLATTTRPPQRTPPNLAAAGRVYDRELTKALKDLAAAA